MRGMEEGGRLTTVVLFGRGRWDPLTRRLEVDRVAVKLPWRAAECLQTLLEAGGEIVSKEDLEQAIWGGALVEESNLAQCVALLRKALDPAPDGGSHIETVARVGYRIAVRVERETGAGAAGGKEPLPGVQGAATGAALDGGDRKPPRRWAVAWLAVTLIAAIAVPLMAWGVRRWQRAERIELLLAEGFDLCRRGNRADANEASQKFSLVLKLDPDNALALAGLAESGARGGKYDGFQAAAHYWISRSSMQLGDDAGALDGHAMEIATWDGLDGPARMALFARFHDPYERGGREALARMWIDEVSDEISAGTHRYNRAVWYAWIGNHQAALEELEAGVEARPFNMIYTAVDPAFEPLRNDPRFHAVLRGIGLE